MKIIGYARVSTTDQDLTIQEAALKAAGANVVLKEKRSGTTTEQREQLAHALGLVGAGDVLLVTRIDRLARGIYDLQKIVLDLKAKGAALRATEQPVDMTTPAGKCFLDMLGVFAEFETNLRKERQAEGIAKAKAAGVYQGRKPVKLDRSQIAAWLDQHKSVEDIADLLDVSRATAFRYVKAVREGTPGIV